MGTPEVIVAIAVVVFTLLCLVMDATTWRIPNWLTVPAFALGVATHTISQGTAGLAFSLLGFLTGFGILLVLWLFGGGGGGDVKMMGALGAWLGAWLTVQVFVVSALATIVLVGGVIVYGALAQGYSKTRRKYTGEAVTLANIARRQGTKPRRRVGRLVPYAVPLALSTWIVLALAIRAGSLF